jgi:hypothetical protein
VKRIASPQRRGGAQRYAEKKDRNHIFIKGKKRGHLYMKWLYHILAMTGGNEGRYST